MKYTRNDKKIECLFPFRICNDRTYKFSILKLPILNFLFEFLLFAFVELLKNRRIERISLNEKSEDSFDISSLLVKEILNAYFEIVCVIVPQNKHDTSFFSFVAATK